MRKIIIAAAGSGGHLFPAVHLANALKSEFQVSFVGGGLAKNTFFKDDYPFLDIPASNRKIHLILQGIWRSVRYLQKQRPCCVIGFGSYHTLPVLLAARLLRVPYILYASDLLPGKVVRWMSAGAEWTGICWKKSAVHLKGTTRQVRPSLRFVPSTDSAADYFGLQRGVLTLLVVGGSQGAVALNDMVVDAIGPSDGLQVIHLTGPKDEERMRQKYAEKGIVACVRPFEERMDYAWGMADFACCRAGANTLFELTAGQVPAVVIPLPTASENHQEVNAKALAGGCLLLQQHKGSEQLREALLHLKNEAVRSHMRQVLERSFQEWPQNTLQDEVREWLLMQ